MYICTHYYCKLNTSIYLAFVKLQRDREGGGGGGEEVEVIIVRLLEPYMPHTKSNGD